MAPSQPVHETLLNWTAPVVVVGTILNWMPQIAALMAVVWYGILIYKELRGKKAKKNDSAAS
jgi:hypothetical protein